jgi:glycosyltransferase involved in cell wall biosynthesis
MKKKIIFFMPSIEGGGVEKNLVILANFFSKHLNDIKLITFDDFYKKKFNKKIKFISFKKTPIRISKYIKYFVCLILLIKEIIFSNVIVFSFQANIYSLILCKLFGKKIILRSNSSPAGWTTNKIKNYIYSYFIKKTDKLIVNSHLFQQQMRNKFNIKSTMIYNPLNLIEIKKKSKKKINKKLIKKDCINIINVGRLTNQKNQILILKALSIIPKKVKINLVIIGYGSQKNNLNIFIKKNNLSNQVTIIKEINNPYKYMSKFDLFVLTSEYEGLPNVLLECLTLKTPIISTNCPTGPYEILKDGKFGTLFKKNDYKKLSKLLIKYKKNKSYFLKKAILGYNSLKRFDYNTNCTKYLNEVKNLDL